MPDEAALTDVDPIDMTVVIVMPTVASTDNARFDQTFIGSSQF